jgi:myo-inositol catabolism protein IolC
VRALRELYAAGVEPAVGTLEVPAGRNDLATLREACRALGGPQVRLVVLGGGNYLPATVAAIRDSAAAGFDGFAVGRSIWDEPLRECFAGGDPGTAVQAMASRYQACLAAFDAGAGKAGSPPGGAGFS